MFRTLRHLASLQRTKLVFSQGGLATYGNHITIPTHGYKTSQQEVQCMRGDYEQASQRCEARALEMPPTDPYAVFVNNEVELSNMKIWGFDYDHTLATYTEALDKFIFTESRDWLVRQMKYPEELMDLEYVADFATRGLHFDVQLGYLMKVDAFHNIQMDTVHRGLTPVSAADTLRSYRGSHLPSTSLKNRIDPGTPLQESGSRMSSVARVHKSGLLGVSIMSNPEKYINRHPELPIFLNTLVASGRKLFVISNSSAEFIDRGMRFLIGEDWKDLFDVIISRANKPKFFQQEANPFRHMDNCGGFKDWDGVKSLHRGHIYEGGSVSEMINMTNWEAENILYFGDHVYSDLADVSNIQGWITAAVIPELETEITVNNSVDFRLSSLKLRALENLINTYQHVASPEAQALFSSWQAERNELRMLSKTSFNKHFGSIFRSFHNPSYFTRRLTQYAVLYTSKVANLHQYPLDHVFYPKRSELPHEC